MKGTTLAMAILTVASMLAMAATAFAVDGVIEINQAKVLAAGGFPYVIPATGSGSYRLTGNLTVTTAGTDAIDVNANNVTIDLNGFTITGPGSGNGIKAGAANAVTIENGIVTGFSTGVLVGANSIVKSVHADSNGIGINAGNNSVISDCTANSASTTGIECQSQCLISGCTVNSATGGIGIELFGKAGVISGVSVNGTTGVPGDGIFLSSSDALITRSTLTNNATYGLRAFDATTGYGENIFDANGTAPVLNGKTMGNNVCSGVLC